MDFFKKLAAGAKKILGGLKKDGDSSGDGGGEDSKSGLGKLIGGLLPKFLSGKEKEEKTPEQKKKQQMIFIIIGGSLVVLGLIFAFAKKKKGRYA